MVFAFAPAPAASLRRDAGRREAARTPNGRRRLRVNRVGRWGPRRRSSAHAAGRGVERGGTRPRRRTGVVTTERGSKSICAPPGLAALRFPRRGGRRRGGRRPAAGAGVPRRSGRWRAGSAGGRRSRRADRAARAVRRAGSPAGGARRPRARRRRQQRPGVGMRAARRRSGSRGPARPARPRYMTMTSSAMWRTTDRSWEMNR